MEFARGLYKYKPWANIRAMQRKLKAFLESQPRGTAATIARELGISPVMVSQYASGEKEVPVRRCRRLCKLTRDVVQPWDLRPEDWWEHWPELIGSPGAPEIAPVGESLQ